MWLEIIIGAVVLAGSAFLSYLLVKAQRKHAQIEEEPTCEEVS